MTGKVISRFQQIANSKGWNFISIGERWGVSERQMSRIANSGNQRDLDAVNGLPPKDIDDMKYEKIIHDQVLYCASELIEALKKLRLLTQEKDGKERRNKATTIDKKLSALATKCSMLEYIYEAAGRSDLRELVLELLNLSMTEATTAMIDPDGWEEACKIAGHSPVPTITVPHDEIRDWRIKFLTAITDN